MRLYRTCSIIRSTNINHFLDTSEEIAAIETLLPTENMIDKVFDRKVSANYSRFCPPQFLPIPLYVSEDSMTTFYEYCFHLLKNINLISYNKPLNANLYFLKIIGQPKVKDISVGKPPAGVMSKTSYAKSHAFIKKLKPFPDIIKYKSVRDKNQKNNYAIYTKNNVKEDGVLPESILVNIKSDQNIEVYYGGKTYGLVF